VLTTGLVNNVTRLTIILGLPTLVSGRYPGPENTPAKRPAKAKTKVLSTPYRDTEHPLNRLVFLLALAAVPFFSGVTWALGADGQLDARIDWPVT
jgi:hypothetical protein